MRGHHFALLAGVASLLAAAPAFAQHEGHQMPGMKMPAPKTTPAPRKPAARKPAPKRPAAARKAPAKRPAVPTKPAPAKPAATKPQADPHAGHEMPVAPPKEVPAEPHADHAMPEPQDRADAHAGHEVSPAIEQAPLVGPPPSEALSGPVYAADTIFGADAMTPSRHVELHGAHGGTLLSKLLVDRAEAQIRNGRDGYHWDAQFWTGGDINKLWLKTEGEGEFRGGLETVEFQALWSHAIDPWFNVQAGVRQDLQPGPDRTYAVVGIEGLAPYWFEVDGALFLSNKGDLAARLEVEYDLRITQRLILQPRLELNLSAQDVPELGTGSGLSTGEAGLRLRYEFVPQFAPYVGVEYERAFGDTRDFRRAAGEHGGGWSFVLGVRAWF